MSKITFNIDHAQSYSEALEEFEKIYKNELDKNEKRQKKDSFLSNLHKLVNSKLNTNFKSTNCLIQALSPFASSSFREKLSKTTSSGRRKTISMNKEIFFSIKKLLSKASPNKAAIAREVGVSVVQVRKVATGGYDKKYGSNAPISVKSKESSPHKKAATKTFPLSPSTPEIDKTQSKSSNNLTRPPLRSASPVKSPLDL